MSDIDQFAAEYAKLVRRFVPTTPSCADDFQRLAEIQQASNPYRPEIWGDQHLAGPIVETLVTIKTWINQQAGIPLNACCLNDIQMVANLDPVGRILLNGFCDTLKQRDLPDGVTLDEAFKSFSQNIINGVDQWLQRGRKEET